MIIEVIQHLVPEAQLVQRGSDPISAEEYADRIEWLDDRPQPSWADIEAARPTVEIQLANDRARINRQQAFTSEADPLFFAWQRGESTESEWLDKVAEIRERYPYTQS